ncbi:MAG: hypothetical protein MUE94_12570 [Verrucomicrobia bacterium]|jgi:predicted esterase|nr:hypothetical protein [Verrucomicrobiota bacterium]
MISLTPKVFRTLLFVTALTLSSNTTLLAADGTVLKTQMATGGFTNHYWLFVPPTAKDAKTPAELWVSMHGVVGNPEHGMAVLANQARERGVFLAAPTGSKPVETPAGQPQNYTWDMERDPEAIIALVDEIRATHPQIAADRVMLVGFSRGGTMGWRTLARYPKAFWLFACLGQRVKDISEAQARAASAAGVRVFLGVGQREDIHKSFAKDHALLDSWGFPNRVVDLENVGHAAGPFVRPLLAWHDELMAARFPGAWTPPPAASPADQMELHTGWRMHWTKPVPKGTEIPDPGISAAAQAAVSPEASDAGWPAYEPFLPFQGLEPGTTATNGEVVVRRTVDIPAGWAGRDLLLELGPVDDFDDTFYDGHLIGKTDKTTPMHWVFPRRYRVPGKLVKPGRAVIAVRVWDWQGEGALMGSPGEMLLRLATEISATEAAVPDQSRIKPGAVNPTTTRAGTH